MVTKPKNKAARLAEKRDNDGFTLAELDAALDAAMSGASEELNAMARLTSERESGINVEAINKMAGNITRKLAEFHEHGRVIRKRGKIVGATQGTGIALTRDDCAEIFESARAELIAGAMRGEKLTREAWRNAATVARRSLYQISKTKAQRDIETAEMDARESNQRNAQQPHLADCLFAPSDESTISERRIVLRAYRNAKRALARHWQSKTYPRAKMDSARDSRALRQAALGILNGHALNTSRESGIRDDATYQRALDLARRVASGHALLVQDRQARALRKATASGKFALAETREIFAQRARGNVKRFADIPRERFPRECLVTLPESPARYTVTRKRGKVTARLS